MRLRFLALVGPPAALDAICRNGDIERRLAPKLVIAARLPWLRLFANPGTVPIVADQGNCVLLGRLLERDGREPLHSLQGALGADVSRTCGQSLIERCWGSYVAFGSKDGDDNWALRDPSGAVPLYAAEHAGVHAYFSDPEASGGLIDMTPDRAFPAQWLAFPYLRTERTGLKHIRECLPGMRLISASARTRAESAWTPWTFAARERAITSFEAAVEQLRDTLLRTIPPHVASYRDLLLELSGGLDSAIVAAALREADLRFSSVNFVTRSPDGDERRYARAVADAVSSPLTEIFEPAGPLKLSVQADQRLRPGLSPVVQPLHEAFAQHAAALGADAFLTGTGGDNVFCYLTTAAPIVDAAWDRGWRAALTGTLPDVAQLCECTIWTAGRFAVSRAFRRPRRPPWKRDVDFLGANAVPTEHDPHPWLLAPPSAAPGKREHVRALVRIQHFLDPENRESDISFVHPLMAQPLLELCLAVPSWMWVRGGRNRAVARAAFRDLVPDVILHRRTKGRLEAMCSRYFAGARAELLEILMNGWLRREGIVDAAAVEAYLRQEGPPTDVRYFRLFELAAMELWRRSWRWA